MAYIQLMSKVLLPLPTELADGLKLEGVCLTLSKIRPENWFLRSSPAFDFVTRSLAETD